MTTFPESTPFTQQGSVGRTSSASIKEFDETCRVHENEIRGKKGIDLLKAHYSFLPRIRSNIPPGDEERRSRYVYTLKGAVKSLSKCGDDVRNHVHMVKLCVHLARTFETGGQKVKLFDALGSRGIGKTSALFYRAWSFFARETSDDRMALDVVNRGIQNGAEPQSDLIALRRKYQYCIDNNGQSPPPENNKAGGGAAQDQARAAQLSRHQQQQQQQQQQQRSMQPAPRQRKGLSVLPDTTHEEPVDAAPPRRARKGLSVLADSSSQDFAEPAPPRRARKGLSVLADSSSQDFAEPAPPRRARKGLSVLADSSSEDFAEPAPPRRQPVQSNRLTVRSDDGRPPQDDDDTYTAQYGEDASRRSGFINSSSQGNRSQDVPPPRRKKRGLAERPASKSEAADSQLHALVKELSRSHNEAEKAVKGSPKPDPRFQQKKTKYKEVPGSIRTLSSEDYAKEYNLEEIRAMHPRYRFVREEYSDDEYYSSGDDMAMTCVGMPNRRRTLRRSMRGDRRSRGALKDRASLSVSDGESKMDGNLPEGQGDVDEEDDDLVIESRDAANIELPAMHAAQTMYTTTQVDQGFTTNVQALQQKLTYTSMQTPSVFKVSNVGPGTIDRFLVSGKHRSKRMKHTSGPRRDGGNDEVEGDTQTMTANTREAQRTVRGLMSSSLPSQDAQDARSSAAARQDEVSNADAIQIDGNRCRNVGLSLRDEDYQNDSTAGCCSSPSSDSITPTNSTHSTTNASSRSSPSCRDSITRSPTTTTTTGQQENRNATATSRLSPSSQSSSPSSRRLSGSKRSRSPSPSGSSSSTRSNDQENINNENRLGVRQAYRDPSDGGALKELGAHKRRPAAATTLDDESDDDESMSPRKRKSAFASDDVKVKQAKVDSSSSIAGDTHTPSLKAKSIGASPIHSNFKFSKTPGWNPDLSKISEGSHENSIRSDVSMRSTDSNVRTPGLSLTALARQQGVTPGPNTPGFDSDGKTVLAPREDVEMSARSHDTDHVATESARSAPLIDPFAHSARVAAVQRAGGVASRAGFENRRDIELPIETENFTDLEDVELDDDGEEVLAITRMLSTRNSPEEPVLSAVVMDEDDADFLMRVRSSPGTEGLDFVVAGLLSQRIPDEHQVLVRPMSKLLMFKDASVGFTPHGATAVTLQDVVTVAAKSSKEILSESFCMYFATEMIRCARALHANGFLHCNVTTRSFHLRHGSKSSNDNDRKLMWPTRGLTLGDCESAVPLELFGGNSAQFVRGDASLASHPENAELFASPAMKACNSRAWRFQVDGVGLARSIHQLVSASPDAELEVTSDQDTLAPVNCTSPFWKEVLTTLLNVSTLADLDNASATLVAEVEERSKGAESVARDLSLAFSNLNMALSDGLDWL